MLQMAQGCGGKHVLTWGGGGGGGRGQEAGVQCGWEGGASWSLCRSEWRPDGMCSSDRDHALYTHQPGGPGKK